MKSRLDERPDLFTPPVAIAIALLRFSRLLLFLRVGIHYEKVTDVFLSHSYCFNGP